MMRTICCAALTLLFSCVTAPEQKPTAKKAAPDAATFFPLQVGTVWNYEVKLLGSVAPMEVRALRKTSEGFIEDSTGAQLMADAFGVRDQKRYLLRNPVEPGTRWTNVVSVSSVEHYEIVATDQPCDAPAGQWNGCVVVESRNRVKEGETLVNEMTFAPGVGLVRISTVLETSGQLRPQSSLSLVKFSPAAP